MIMDLHTGSALFCFGVLCSLAISLWVGSRAGENDSDSTTHKQRGGGGGGVGGRGGGYNQGSRVSASTNSKAYNNDGNGNGNGNGKAKTVHVVVAGLCVVAGLASSAAGIVVISSRRNVVGAIPDLLEDLIGAEFPSEAYVGC